ncbi:DUF5794 domain-containing protein [Salarchaeum japonicum]|uniref:DUF5794 domain-containing protein n=1 Tax=Salarchaeum japonicum TaxID=555573 RepID=A0AAV3T3P1_9EURY|nr:DUF5794 domain-containing protein [Salarchaeum japonicum]
MSSSRHPIALRLERQVGGATRLLATVMLLPLVDGIFPALVLAGALDTWTGVLQVGLLVFGGSATVAVILAELETDVRKQARAVLTVGVPLVALAVVEAALAPTIESLLNIHVFERFAGLVILAIAAKTASATIGEYLPSPGVIVGLGFVAAVSLGDVTLSVQTNPTLMLHAAAAGLVAVLFALGVVFAQPYLYRLIDIDRFRFGSAVALATLALSLFVPATIPPEAPIVVFAVAGVLAIDPDAADELAHGDASASQPAATDGGDDDEESGRAYPGEDAGEERAPWL